MQRHVNHIIKNLNLFKMYNPWGKGPVRIEGFNLTYQIKKII